tara:strand:- start:82 stop:2427 length:2346 start_codon:yes stop_codon:yes gene_type:complete
MSYKQISDIEQLYAGVHNPINEEFNDIMLTVIYGMCTEGYSEGATISFLESATEVDIVDKYFSVDIIEKELEYFEAMESGILTEEYIEEKFGKWIKNIKDIKNLKNLRPGQIVKSVKKSINPKGFARRQKYEKELLKVNPKANKKVLDRYANARLKGKDVAVSTRFANKQKSLMGKIKDTAAGLLPWAVGGAVVAPTISNMADKGEKDNLKSNEKDLKAQDKTVVPKGQEKITNPEYGKDNKATDHKGRDFDDPKAHSSVRGGPTETIIKSEKPKVEKPKVEKPKVDDYLGKSQGLSGKEKWLKDTSNSPAAKSGAFKPEDRWAQQLKHRQWQKDNNRGAFKAQTKKVPVTDTVQTKGLSKEHFAYTESLVEGNIEYSISYFSDGIDIQEKFGTRLIGKQIKKGLSILKKSGMADDLGPSATMSGLSQKMGSPSDAVKGFVDGASDAANFIKRVIKGKKSSLKNPVSKPKLTQNAPSTERIPSGGSLAVRKPSMIQKVKDAANDMKPGIKAAAKTAKETFKKGVKGTVKLAPKAAAVVGGSQVGIEVNKRLKKESYDAFDLVLDYLVETQQVDSVEEALYVMMEMDQDAIYGIVQEKSIIPVVKSVQKPLKTVVKKTVETLKNKLHGGLRKPSTGKYNVKGGRKVKATQGAKQEGTFNTRQKDKLKAQQAAKPEAKAQADAAAKVNAPRSGVDVRKGKAPAKDVDARNMKGPKYENFDLLDENMKAKLAKNTVRKAIKAAKKMPEYVRDSIKRQYKAGTPGAAPYTIEDKKNVLNWYKNNK